MITSKNSQSRLSVDSNELEKNVFVVNTINYDTETDTFNVEGWTSRDTLDEGKEIFFKKDNHSLAAANIKHKTVGNSEVYSLTISPSEGELTIGITEGDHTSKTIPELKIIYSKLSRLNGEIKHDYRLTDGWVVQPQGNNIVFRKAKLSRVLKKEFLFFINSIFWKRNENAASNIIKTFAIEPLRVAAIIQRKLQLKKVWLFSDRISAGGDNSEALFRHVLKNGTGQISPYFTVSKESNTYREMKKAEIPVVNFKSIRRLYLTMIAEAIFPSHLEAGYTQPWTKMWPKYCGVVQHKIIHTQHGLVINDMSQYISKYNTNAELFLVASEWERRQLLKKEYGYGEDQIVVTGMPRYDAYEVTSKEQKRRTIAVHPTWRSWLAMSEKGGKREYCSAFKDGAFFKFYNSLLKDKRIIEALERNNYVLDFYLHPNHLENLNDFGVGHNERIKIKRPPHNYTRMINNSSILVTDYSNILFDFAYLKKPIFHCQFDRDEFFSKQVSMKEATFNYEELSFGPVGVEYEDCVNGLVKLLDEAKAGNNTYAKRIDDFFVFIDRDNCQRAYEAVMKKLGKV